MNTKTKKYTSIGAIIALIILIDLGATMAYFTSTDTATNNFTVGSVRTILHEDKWDDLADTNNDKLPDVAENITPNKVLTKDPAIENTGKNSAWVYLEVKVPSKNIIVAREDGTRLTSADTELFSFTPGSAWTELNKTISKDEVIYVYGYSTQLAPGKITSTLFDTIKFCNAIETQGLEDSAQKIQIKSMAIQSEQSGTLQEAYAKYINQNK